MRAFLISMAALAGFAAAGPAFAAGEVKHPEKMPWSFSGPFGKFDVPQLQRGFQVYKEVCSSCHSMNLMSYRNLGQKGGPWYSEEYKNPNDNPYVKAIAASYTVADVDASGEAIERPGRPSDRFVSPYESEAQARGANGGALPPDLSVIIKARHDGANYVHGLMTGYNKPMPDGMVVPDGKHFNPYFAGGMIGMAEQLADGRVDYAPTEANKGIKNTEEQMSQDVVAFLTWASEPKQQLRKETGLAVMLYLSILAIVLFLSYRAIWRDVEH